MQEEELKQFLNKSVRILFDVGGSRNFQYCGELTDVNSENVSIFDRKIGQTLLSNDRIVGISEWNEVKQ